MTSKPPSRTADQFVVRFPDGMRDRIAEAAKANNRSMNAEIVSRLEQTFGQQFVLRTSEEIRDYAKKIFEEQFKEEAERTAQEIVNNILKQKNIS